MIAGLYIKLARAVCFALHRQRTLDINSVNINTICISTVLRYRRTAADNSVFRAVRRDNRRAVGQLYRNRRRGGKRNALQRERLGGAVPC